MSAAGSRLRAAVRSQTIASPKGATVGHSLEHLGDIASSMPAATRARRTDLLWSRRPLSRMGDQWHHPDTWSVHPTPVASPSFAGVPAARAERAAGVLGRPLPRPRPGRRCRGRPVRLHRHRRRAPARSPLPRHRAILGVLAVLPAGVRLGASFAPEGGLAPHLDSPFEIPTAATLAACLAIMVRTPPPSCWAPHSAGQPRFRGVR